MTDLTSTSGRTICVRGHIRAVAERKPERPGLAVTWPTLEGIARPALPNGPA